MTDGGMHQQRDRIPVILTFGQYQSALRAGHVGSVSTATTLNLVIPIGVGLTDGQSM